MSPTKASAPGNRIAHLEQTLRAGRIELARKQVHDILQNSPDVVEALNNIGVAHKRANRLNEAASYYRHALAISPTRPSTLSNLALVLKAQGQLAEAEACCRLALLHDADSLSACYNLGIILKAQGRFKEAGEAFSSVLSRQANYADAAFDLALIELLCGQFEQGWPHYESRFDPKLSNPQKMALPQTTVPRWTGGKGGDPVGLRLLLLHEQGFGDQIQFCRYANELKRRGAQVSLVVKPELVRLLGTLSGADAVLSSESPIDWLQFDAWTPLMSLPSLLGTRVDNIPDTSAYLSAEPGKVRDWQERLATPAGFRKIGLVWGGSPTHARDHERSLALADLRGLLQTPGCRFISLQKGPRAAELQTLPAAIRPFDAGSELHDFSDTAAALSVLDLLISVDTATAHLAGALGRPAWILLSFVPDWRWLVDRKDSPWYPSLRLFRQPHRLGWPDCLHATHEALLQAR